MPVPTKRRMIHSFQFRKAEDTSKLITEIAEMKINLNPTRALFQLIDIQKKAKEIENRRFDYV
jgi:hypothetical protein